MVYQKYLVPVIYFMNVLSLRKSLILIKDHHTTLHYLILVENSDAKKAKFYIARLFVGSLEREHKNSAELFGT